MPESSECRLTAEFLNEYLQNTCITDWSFIAGKYEKSCPNGFEEFDNELPLIVEGVYCKGKFIYFILTTIKTFKSSCNSSSN